MKITVKKPTGEVAKKISDAKESLNEITAAIETEQQQSESLRQFIATAEADHAECSKKVDRDMDAATRMAGLNLQLQSLRAQLQRRAHQIPHLLRVATGRISQVRQEVIQQHFGNEMVAALRDEIGKRLRPFYRTLEEARLTGTYYTGSAAILAGFLGRREPHLPDADSAKQELLATINELDCILNGEPLVDVTASAE